MNPVSEIKSNLSVGKIIGWLVLAVVVLAIADAAGVTAWVLTPYSSFKAKFLTKSGG